MGHLERALEWLRPILISSQTFDYCVIWKLSEISRSIEWLNCCCINSPTEEDKQVYLGSTALCRDSFNPHLGYKKSCLALAHFPFSIPLQSGIYEEVISSSQPRWINFPDDPDKFGPKAFHETTGTRVLIPVVGGLVELFSATQIMEDQEIMEFVAAPFHESLKMDTFPSLNFDEDDTFTEDRKLFLGECTNNWTDYFQESNCKPLMLDLLSGLYSNHPNLEGSSSGSIPLCLGLGIPSENSSPIQKLEVYSPLESVELNKDQYLNKQIVELNSGCDTCVTGNEISVVNHEEDRQEASQKRFKSKNLIVERKRRARIKRGLCDLRALVPKISKMSQSATLDDAADNIVELETKIKDLQKELEELETDERDIVTKSKLSASNVPIQVAAKLNIHQLLVEVNPLTRRDFLIKILCKAKTGAFTRVLEILECLDLQVTEINATSCKGLVSNSFVVQANNGEIQAGKLRDMLIKHACG